MNSKRKLMPGILSLALAAALVFGSPLGYVAKAADTTQYVYVTIENETYSVDNGAAWEGAVKTKVAYTDGMTASAAIKSAISAQGMVSSISDGGYGDYISSVNNVAGGDNGSASGWMVFLNDWALSQGISYVYPSAGDSISVAYTSADDYNSYGADLNSSYDDGTGNYGNDVTTLASLNFSSGTLDRTYKWSDFYKLASGKSGDPISDSSILKGGSYISGANHSYVLTIPSGTTQLKVNAAALNKNFQVRIYKNHSAVNAVGSTSIEDILSGFALPVSPMTWDTITEGTGFYKQNQSISVEKGDYLTVACGLAGWSTSNSGQTGSTYMVRIKNSQTISGSALKSTTKTYGAADYSIGATAKTKLSYKSSNTKVATVSTAGKIHVAGPGKTTITVKAASSNSYNAASKSFVLTVKPKTQSISLASDSNSKLQVTMKKDSSVSGYQIVYAKKSTFTGDSVHAVKVSGYTNNVKVISGLKSGARYYVKARAYKKTTLNGTTYTVYGSYSKAVSKIVK